MRSRSLLVVALAVAILGCSGEAPPPPQYTHHIQKIFHVWLVYKTQNENKDPADAKELRTWVMENKDVAAVADTFKKMGISDVEGAFTSPRDGQPYVLGRLDLDQDGFDPTIAYEQKGVGGKRFVVTETGRAEEIEEAVFLNALKKKG